MSSGRSLKKRERMVTLRVNDRSFNIIRDFAANRGLSVNAYLNSVIDSQAEWFIPTSSYAAVTVPKAMLGTLFSMIDRQNIEVLAKKWAAEARNIIMLSGEEPSVESALDFVRKVSKYFMGTDARINLTDKVVSIAIRHDGGANFSYFTAQSYVYLFQRIEVRAFVDHDETTVFIRMEKP
ncbi:MAG: hypothetical protein AB1351_13400 [Thermoproteota archaeon]